ncbi:MAG: imidazolonepropionase, partial [Planctomycetota bacterium]|nr:imidazolonepropionase [Planctomycetota bacterium]
MKRKKVADLIITSAGELVTLAGEKNKPTYETVGRPSPRCGTREMNSLGIVHNGAVAIKGSKILAVADTREILSKYSSPRVINAKDRTVTPGLIDSHTHPVFIGDRADEFEMRLKGISYQEIADKGGGIKSTVLRVRNATRSQLKQNTLKYLKRFIACGTTTIEAKSGYGLTTKDEIKILEVIKELTKVCPLEMVATFLGAHEFPDEYKDNKQGYVDLITREMLPLVAKRKLAEFCDVFVEKGVFSIDQASQILRSAREHGLKIKLHVDEFTTLGGAELAAEFNATSADHLMMASNYGLTQMKQKGVIAVLLPGTTFMLGLWGQAISSLSPAQQGVAPPGEPRPEG